MSTEYKDDKSEADIKVQDVGGVEVADQEEITEADQAYLNASKFTRFYRSTLFQIIVLGA
jgi:hypothetical protein